MKNILSLFLMIIITITTFAQIPQAFKYQAIARDNTGGILANQNISFKITILHGDIQNYVVYIETHNISTNQFGLANMEIGKGNVVFGVFTTIKWNEGSYFIQTEMDENGENNFIMMGTTQLLSTPYALHAGVSSSLLLTDSNGNNYTIGIDTLGNLTTSVVYEWTTCGDTLIDKRDGQKYATVLIGTQCWMSENLNIGSRIDAINEQQDNLFIEKYCYNDVESNCNDYGGLYQWNEMMAYSDLQGVQGICPDAWHLPTDEEWKQLEGEVDSFYDYPSVEWDSTGLRGVDAGLNLKSISGWYSGGNGSGLYGFEALPAGLRNSIGSMGGMGVDAYFWTSYGYNVSNAWGRRLSYANNDIRRTGFVKEFGFSVRCLKD